MMHTAVPAGGLVLLVVASSAAIDSKSRQFCGSRFQFFIFDSSSSRGGFASNAPPSPQHHVRKISVIGELLGMIPQDSTYNYQYY